MPQVYTTSLATPGTLSTSATPGTAIETWFLKPGANASTYLEMVQINGAGGGLTQLSAITQRLYEWATASTAGTAMTPGLTDKSGGAAASTCASRPTAGTTRLNRGVIVGCSATGPGFWSSGNDYDRMLRIAAGNAGSLAAEDVGAIASLAFGFTFGHREM